MMDVGIYPLNGIRYLAQEEPSEFTAVVATRDKDDPRFKEVEQSVEWTMKFPSGIVASCGMLLRPVRPHHLSIHGDLGYIALNPAFGGGGIQLTGKRRRQRLRPDSAPARATSNWRWKANTSPIASATTPSRTPGEEGLKDLIAIERIYQAAGSPIA
jgi:predicted dehydrogenase